jgi:hypothetical protein
MSDELKDLSPAQIAIRVAFACVITAAIAILVFYGILWLISGRCPQKLQQPGGATEADRTYRMILPSLVFR